MQGDESPVSVTYQVNGFDEVLEVVAQLTEQGIVSYYSCKTGGKLKETFVQLQTMFILVSVFIVVIALTISGMLLMKLARMRSGEIGLLMALGYHRGQIQKMLLWESLLLSSLSALTNHIVLHSFSPPCQGFFRFILPRFSLLGAFAEPSFWYGLLLP